MDLIYMNPNKEDVGVLLDYELDLAYGADENSFECKIQAQNHCCGEGYFLYIDGTEYGGIIDRIQVDTSKNEVTYSGRTWQGILNSKVIYPLKSGDTWPSGVTAGGAVGRYLVLSGDANACIGAIIGRTNLSTLFRASETSAGAAISSYQFHRYIDVYSGLRKMLRSAGLKMKTTFEGGMVVLSAVPLYDYSQDEEFDSDSVEFRLQRNYKTVNHLVCLGSGELENRMVVHLYADAVGNISQTKTFTGLDEYEAVFDYPSVESAEELIYSGTEELKALWSQNELSISFDPEADLYDVGDIVGAYDNITKIAVSAEIVKKIVTIQNGQTNISYEVGEK